METENQNTLNAEDLSRIADTLADFSYAEVGGVVNRILERYVETFDGTRTTVFFIADHSTGKLFACTRSPNKQSLANVIANAMEKYKPLAEAIIEAADWYQANRD